MNTKDDELERKQDSAEDDTEGHSLLLDTDYYIQRKMGREAEIDREARQRRELKESRPNKPERR